MNDVWDTIGFNGPAYTLVDASDADRLEDQVRMTLAGTLGWTIDGAVHRSYLRILLDSEKYPCYTPIAEAIR